MFSHLARVNWLFSRPWWVRWRIYEHGNHTHLQLNHGVVWHPNQKMQFNNNIIDEHVWTRTPLILILNDAHRSRHSQLKPGSCKPTCDMVVVFLADQWLIRPLTLKMIGAVMLLGPTLLQVCGTLQLSCFFHRMSEVYMALPACFPPVLCNEHDEYLLFKVIFWQAEMTETMKTITQSPEQSHWLCDCSPSLVNSCAGYIFTSGR